MSTVVEAGVWAICRVTRYQLPHIADLLASRGSRASSIAPPNAATELRRLTDVGAANTPISSPTPARRHGFLIEEILVS
jgi:hypothetical protein